MTIIVVTTEHGDRSFEANDWKIKEGRLWVGTTSDVGVAEFAIGSWQFVYETDDSQPKHQPRVWASLTDVPMGVGVTDVEGDFWQGEGPAGSRVYDEYGPFTEYLESE